MDQRSPFVHTVVKCFRGASYLDLIFINDFGLKFVNFHGAAERFSYRSNIPEKFIEDYYQCELTKVPRNRLCFELLEEKVKEVANKTHTAWKNGTDNGKELLSVLSVDQLQYSKFDKTQLKSI